MLKLTDLTENQRIVLHALHELRTASRSAISATAGLDRDRVSSFLNRLESFGLVDKSENSTWTITAAGDALYGPAAASPEPDRTDSDPVVELEPVVEVTLDEVRMAILEEIDRIPPARWPDPSFDVWVLEQVASKIYPDMPVAAARLRVISEKIGACA